MANLFTLVTVAQMSLISHVGDAPVVIPLKPVTTSVPHLSWDTCQILAQQKRDGVALGEKLDVQCQPEDASAAPPTGNGSGTVAATDQSTAHVPPPSDPTTAGPVQRYALRAEYTVDGKSYADSQAHLSLDDCHRLIAKAKQIIAIEGAGHQVTLSSECVPEGAIQ